MNFIANAAHMLRGAVGLASSAPAERPGHSSKYMRGGRDVTFAGWRPSLRETQDDISDAWDEAAARTIDLIQNSGWLAGMVEQAVANTVGPGLRLMPKPENSLFGMNEKAAREWGKMVASRWETYARSPQECDIQGIRTHGQMQAAAFKSWLGTGEILAELPKRRRAWNKYATKIRVMSPARLSRKTDTTARLVNGVYLDQDGMPIGYLATKKDPLLGTVEYRVRARDGNGMAGVIHVFTGMPETYRGISPATPALQVGRQFDQLSNATLMAAIVKQLFAITITGDAPTEEILQGLLTPQEMARSITEGTSPLEAYMEASAGYYDASTLNVGINGRMAHLFPGQEMKMVTAQMPGSEYKDYAQHLLREICRCLGMTYESGTGDYSGATYSSVRMATGEIFAITLLRRAHVVIPFCQATYEAWLEEEIVEHGLPFPGGPEAFYANRVAACRAEWRGTAKPQADDLKTAKAHEIWKRLGVMSDEMIASDLGVDIEDVYVARAAEAELRKFYGVEDAMLMGANGGAPGGPPGGPDEDDDEEAK
jgi:lambda family phage portal protein